jgi:hypothetical protein
LATHGENDAAALDRPTRSPLKPKSLPTPGPLMAGVYALEDVEDRSPSADHRPVWRPVRPVRPVRVIMQSKVKWCPYGRPAASHWQNDDAAF